MCLIIFSRHLVSGDLLTISQNKYIKKNNISLPINYLIKMKGGMINMIKSARLQVRSKSHDQILNSHVSLDRK